jgi:glycine C-acetyltransferase
LVPLLAREIKKLTQAGLYKRDTVFLPDGREADVPKRLINYTGNDYLGLARNPQVKDAAIQAIESLGFGQASTRMMGGTRSVHRELEQRLARFLGTQRTVAFSSGYHVNLGLFQAFFDDRDFVFCDSLIHSSLAEGVRLSGAKTFSYANNDMDDLEDKLKRSRAARFRAIVTTGVFPFDGAVADLAGICELAKKFDAIVVVDDSLGIGILGQRGRGSCELRGVMGQVDLVTGSFGNALGGSMGGFAAGCEEIILWLRQKSTPYLFSGALSPAMAAGALKALQLLEEGEPLLKTLRERTSMLRKGLEDSGFSLLPGEHPIVAVMVGEVVTLQKMVNILYGQGIYAHGLCYPVVPEREARIRLQVTALHSEDDIRQTVSSFVNAGRELGVL